jgi:hypothetical protein
MKMVPKIMAILDKFKESCNLHGWKTAEAEDWVEADDKYHSFLWTRNLHLSSFKRIMSKSRCVVRRGLSYEVVDASYVAWLFLEKPLEDVVKEVAENPDFSARTALYDLSAIPEGKVIAIKVNKTDSPVFQEFEQFLKDEFGLKLKAAELHPAGKSENDDYVRIEEIA